LIDKNQILLNGVVKARAIQQRNKYEDNLYEFLKGGWRYIDPAKFQPGWHLEAICEHLEAVTYGQIKRLVINIPPRSSKSSVVSVAWPAWTWAQQLNELYPLAGPRVQFLTSSYASTLSMRDSVKMRRLIESPWYQEQWGDRFYLTSDQNTKMRFENNYQGYRLSTSVDGTTTGEGGTIIIVDDAHNANETESDTVRKGVLSWWDEVMSTRLNDPNTGAYVVVMQRLHQEDLTGHIITRERNDWTWLMLPMEYESDRHCTTYVNGIEFWSDPRTEDGELLCPVRFSRESVEKLKRSLGPYGASGQLQQAPVPRGGGIIHEEWWQHLENPLDNSKPPNYPHCDFVVASLDTAYTEKEENDYSALTIWGVFKDVHGNPKICLIYAWKERLDFNDLVEKVIDSCTVDKKKNPRASFRFPIDLLIIESKAAGLSVYQEIERRIGFQAKFGIQLFDPKKYGDKTARLYSIQHIFSSGMVYVPFVAPLGYLWATELIQEVAMYPKAPHDDLTDSMSMALRYLRDMNFALTSDEKAEEDASQFAYQSNTQPLYPCAGSLI